MAHTLVERLVSQSVSKLTAKDAPAESHVSSLVKTTFVPYIDLEEIEKWRRILEPAKSKPNPDLGREILRFCRLDICRHIHSTI